RSVKTRLELAPRGALHPRLRPSGPRIGELPVAILFLALVDEREGAAGPAIASDRAAIAVRVAAFEGPYLLARIPPHRIGQHAGHPLAQTRRKKELTRGLRIAVANIDDQEMDVVISAGARNLPKLTPGRGRRDISIPEPLECRDPVLAIIALEEALDLFRPG